MSGVLGAVTTTIPGFPTGGTGPGFSSGSSTLTVPGASSTGSGVVNSVLGVSSIASALIEVVALVTVLSVVGIVVIAVVANRADPDPTGRRPQSVYFFMVSYVAITTAISGSAYVVAAILVLTAHHTASVGHDIDRLLLAGALVTIVSLCVLSVHVRRGLTLARADDSLSNPSKRVGQTYVAVVSFVSILVVLVTSVLAIYTLFAIAAPGTFGSFGGRGWAARVLIESVYLLLVATYLLWRHSSLLTPGLGIFARKVSGSGGIGSAPLGEPPAPQPLG